MIRIVCGHLLTPAAFQLPVFKRDDQLVAVTQRFQRIRIQRRALARIDDRCLHAMFGGQRGSHLLRKRICVAQSGDRNPRTSLINTPSQGVAPAGGLSRYASNSVCCGFAPAGGSCRHSRLRVANLNPSTRHRQQTRLPFRSQNRLTRHPNHHRPIGSSIGSSRQRRPCQIGQILICRSRHQHRDARNIGEHRHVIRAGMRVVGTG